MSQSTPRIVVRAHGGPRQLEMATVTLDDPGETEVLVRNEAIGVNFVDVQHRMGGYYPLDPPFTPGIEAVGVIEATGSGVLDFKVGDRVGIFGCMPGIYSQRLVVSADQLVGIPDDISSEMAAASLLQGTTAALFTREVYPLAAGEWVLVHAASGGVGSMLVQIAKQLGARVIGMVSTPAKAQFARACGADHVLTYGQDEERESIDILTDGEGVHVAYDGVGRATFDTSVAAVRKRGTVVLYGQTSGPVPPFDVNRLSGITAGSGRGSLSLIWAAASHYTETAEQRRRHADHLFRGIREGVIVPRIAGRFPLAEAARAHAELEARHVQGKLLLIP